MADINKVILEGNLGSDPVIRISPDKKKAMATAALYTSYSKRVGSQYELHSDRHNLVLFDDNAEAARNFTKGTRLKVEGRLQTRKYADRETGLDKYITEVVVSDVKIVMRVVRNDQQSVVNG